MTSRRAGAPSLRRPPPGGGGHRHGRRARRAGRGRDVTAEPTGPILKPLPERVVLRLRDERRDALGLGRPPQYATRQARLFVRNHTSTPVIDAPIVRAAGVRRRAGDAARRDRRAVADPRTTCTGCRRRRSPPCTSAPATGAASSAPSRARPASGTPWLLGAVGTVRWQGVRLKHLLRRVGISPDAVSIQATGLDPNYVSGGVDYGPVRRPFPVAKALDDAILAWGMNGEAAAARPRLPAPPGAAGLGRHRQHQVARLARGLHERAHLALEHEVVPDDRRRVPGGQPAAHREPGALGVGAALGRPAAAGPEDPADRSLVERGRHG